VSSISARAEAAARRFIAGNRFDAFDESALQGFVRLLRNLADSIKRIADGSSLPKPDEVSKVKVLLGAAQFANTSQGTWIPIDGTKRRPAETYDRAELNSWVQALTQWSEQVGHFANDPGKEAGEEVAELAKRLSTAVLVPLSNSGESSER